MDKLSIEDFNQAAMFEQQAYQIALGLYRERCQSNGIGPEAAKQAFAGADAFIAEAEERIQALYAKRPDEPEPAPEVEINVDDLDPDPELCKPGFGARAGEAPDAASTDATGGTGPETPAQSAPLAEGTAENAQPVNPGGSGSPAA